MARQHNYTVEAGPSMFDEMPQGNEQHTFNDLFAELNELRQMVEDTGFYFALPNEALATRAETYYNNHIEQIRAVLDASGTAADVADVVTTDYANVLFGSRVPKATPDQMKTALKVFKPYKAYSIDRYGLYWALLLNYSRCLNMWGNYQYDVAGVTATPESKQEFINGFYSAADARAVLWLASIGELTPAAFAGVFETNVVNSFMDRVTEWGNLYEYSALYFIAKYALLATPQELDAITKPPIHSQTPILDFAEQFAAEAQQRLGKTADKYGAAFEAEKTAEKEQAAEGANNWRDNANTQILQLHEVPNIICSMPVQISPNGAEIVNTLPVQRYIDNFMKLHPEFGLITPMTVQKVFEAVNLFPCYLKPTKIDKYRLQYNLNRSQLAELCGYQDANQTEKLALVGSLVMFNGLFVVVNRPIRYYETQSLRGRKRKVQTGGQTAVQIINVPAFDITHEGITVDITPEAFKGKPTLITYGDYKKLRSEAKGLSQSRFNYQLLTKGHKKEDDLINDVFGYDEKSKLAADDPEALKRVKEYIRKHRTGDKKKLIKWFNDYKAKGIITYKYNARTKVYTWDRVTPLTEQEKELLKNYDPATEAEEQ